MLAEFFIASSRLILGAPLLTRRMDHYSGLRRQDRAPQIQNALRLMPRPQLVCWIAESSQKVQTSVLDRAVAAVDDTAADEN
jgi:type II secretory pathway component PulM